MFPSSQPLLHLVGTSRGERREVRWGDTRASLTPKCFKFLAKLAVARFGAPARWVQRDELEKGENQARYLYRLKGELESQCGELPQLWENNRRGGYRLIVPPDRIQINWDGLEEIEDWDLKKWVMDFRPRTARPGPIPLGPAADQPAAA